MSVLDIRKEICPLMSILRNNNDTNKKKIVMNNENYMWINVFANQ